MQWVWNSQGRRERERERERKRAQVCPQTSSDCRVSADMRACDEKARVARSIEHIEEAIAVTVCVWVILSLIQWVHTYTYWFTLSLIETERRPPRLLTHPHNTHTHTLISACTEIEFCHLESKLSGCLAQWPLYTPIYSLSPPIHIHRFNCIYMYLTPSMINLPPSLHVSGHPWTSGIKLMYKILTTPNYVLL